MLPQPKTATNRNFDLHGRAAHFCLEIHYETSAMNERADATPRIETAAYTVV